VPGFNASAVGCATVTTTLLLSSSRVNDRLSAGTGGQPAGTVTRAAVPAAPRVLFVAVIVKCRGSREEPSTGHSSSSGAIAISTSRVTKIGRRTSPIAWSR
jgi:hypothetical protein